MLSLPMHTIILQFCYDYLCIVPESNLYMYIQYVTCGVGSSLVCVVHVERLRLELCDCMVDRMKKSAVTRKVMVFKFKTSYSMCSIAMKNGYSFLTARYITFATSFLRVERLQDANCAIYIPLH